VTSSPTLRTGLQRPGRRLKAPPGKGTAGSKTGHGNFTGRAGAVGGNFCRSLVVECRKEGSSFESRHVRANGQCRVAVGRAANYALSGRVAAALEGARRHWRGPSGHAAQLLAFHVLLEPGDGFIASRQLYAGSINQFNHAFKKFGWNVVWADGNDPASFEAAVTPKTKAIFIESVANSGGVVIDVAAISAVAADIVRHSLTKFMGGQGNSLGGVIVDCRVFDWIKSGRCLVMCDIVPQ
jgi:O-acetylhomoserine/O-acetylserine sulfhydrylase-like pyridoxal-dependent enzyme